MTDRYEALYRAEILRFATLRVGKTSRPACAEGGLPAELFDDA
jgi:hypothetical protein